MLRSKLTPPKLAEHFGVSVEKILTWIHAGELRAINAATRLGGRPRYLIDPADVLEFERRRAVVPVHPSPRRRKQQTCVTEYL